MTRNQTTEFEAWLNTLNAEAIKLGYVDGERFWQATGAECWREYFDCGTSPRDALIEDESHG